MNFLYEPILVGFNSVSVCRGILALGWLFTFIALMFVSISAAPNPYRRTAFYLARIGALGRCLVFWGFIFGNVTAPGSPTSNVSVVLLAGYIAELCVLVSVSLAARESDYRRDRLGLKARRATDAPIEHAAEHAL